MLLIDWLGGRDETESSFFFFLVSLPFTVKRNTKESGLSRKNGEMSFRLSLKYLTKDLEWGVAYRYNKIQKSVFISKASTYRWSFSPEDGGITQRNVTR